WSIRLELVRFGLGWLGYYRINREHFSLLLFEGGREGKGRVRETSERRKKPISINCISSGSRLQDPWLVHLEKRNEIERHRDLSDRWHRSRGRHGREILHHHRWIGCSFFWRRKKTKASKNRKETLNDQLQRSRDYRNVRHRHP
ncbi:hypothetical protein B296_00056378, partial [Ensete ventricosum]